MPILKAALSNFLPVEHGKFALCSPVVTGNILPVMRIASRAVKGLQRWCLNPGGKIMPRSVAVDLREIRVCKP